MFDEVFGSVPYTQGFINTLFGGNIDPDLVADMDGFDKWVSEDGSQGGSLWVWHGTNAEGNPFELVGLSIVTFDEDGKLVREVDSYPYPDEYVVEALFGAGTGSTSQDVHRVTSTEPVAVDWTAPSGGGQYRELMPAETEAPPPSVPVTRRGLASGRASEV